MSRRLLAVLSVVCVAALSVTAVALAHSGGKGDPAKGKTKTAHAKRLPGGGLMGVVLDSLAGRLSVAPADLRAAVTAVAREQAAYKGHDLALACFDTPASCDLKALRAEVTFFAHKKHQRGTPGGSGSGQMHPGGRPTSAPLR